MAIAAYAFLIGGAPNFAVFLLVVAGLVMAVSIYRHNFFEGRSRRAQFIGETLVSLCVALVLAVLWFTLRPDPPPRAEVVTNSQPTPLTREDISEAVRKEIAPLLGPTFTEKIERVTIRLSATHSYTYPVEGLEKQNVLRLGEHVPFKLHVSNNKLFADVKLWNSGKPPVEIKNNEFIVRPTNWDRNSSAQVLEIVDEHQRPVFQMIYRTASVVEIRGLFSGSDGGLVIFNEKGMIGNPRNLADIERFRPKPIFRYPSWQYPHEYLR